MGIVVRIVNGRKQCTKCKKWKLLDEFTLSRTVKSGRHSHCKRCAADWAAEKRQLLPLWALSQNKRQAQKRRERYAADPEFNATVRAKQKAWQESLPEEKIKRIRWRNHLITSYRMTLEEYDALVESHKGICGCCGKVPRKGKLMIDHNHTTGKIRGLICPRCNSGLGFFGDSADGLEKALAYLRKTDG